jgi:group II intron reverse transcriptase/maturase
MDIQKFFDEIDHELMLKAVTHVMKEKWVKMYVERWLQMPIMKKDGTLEQRNGKGTPQGGVISPLLANLYLHFALDMWLNKHYPEVSFVRYADDMVIHCRTKEEAEKVLEAVKIRLSEVKLEIKQEKTRIAYCKDYRRKLKHGTVKFEFLGFSFQPRARKSKIDGKQFTAFTAEISQSNQKRIRGVIREAGVWRDTRLKESDIAEHFNDKLRGWIDFYGLFSNRCLRLTLLNIDIKLIKWMRKKYRLGTKKAVDKLILMKAQTPKLFYHWETGIC